MSTADLFLPAAVLHGAVCVGGGAVELGMGRGGPAALGLRGAGAELGMVEAQATGALAPGAGTPWHPLPLHPRRHQGGLAPPRGGALQTHPPFPPHHPSGRAVPPHRYERIRQVLSAAGVSLTLLLCELPVFQQVVRYYQFLTLSLCYVQFGVSNSGKTFFTWFGPVPRVMIMDPELVREILSNKSGHFGRASLSPLGRALASGLISYHGGKWAKHRRILNPAFHVEKLKVIHNPWFST
ncbi:hypothetical protein GW17_00020037 [Ensete ventricosum]|nr:hypothetical protein GW17_00020037 [Ensete ventricosum]